MPLEQIKEGDSLHYLRQFDNLYVPFGKADIRLVEDIGTKPPYENIVIRTDGDKVLEVVGIEPAPKNTWAQAKQGKKLPENDQQITF